MRKRERVRVRVKKKEVVEGAGKMKKRTSRGLVGS